MATKAELLKRKAELEAYIASQQEQAIYFELTPEQIADYITSFHPNKEMQREIESEISVTREELHEILEKLRNERERPG